MQQAAMGAKVRGRLPAVLLVAGLLMGCSGRVPRLPHDTPQPTPVVRGEAASAGSTRPVESDPPLPRATAPAVPSPEATATATPAPTLAPPTPTATPSPPLLLPALAGAEMALSLEPLTSVDTHIMAGATTEGGQQGEGYSFASLDRVVYAYGTGGQPRWKVRMGGPVYALAGLDGGELAAGDDLGTVMLLSSSGARLWSHSLGTRVTALSGGLPEGLLAGGWDEHLTLLAQAPEGERVLWQVGVGGRVTGIAALPELAVASSGEGDVIALSASGEPQWRYRAGAPVVRLAADLVPVGGAEQEQGVVLVGVQDGRLLVLGRDGEPLWERDLGDGSPVWSLAPLGTGEGPVLLAATGGASPVLSVLSTEGTWVWRLALPAPAGAVAALDLDADGQREILVGLLDGRVMAYDRQGALRASVQAGLPVWDLLPEGDGAGPSCLVLADLNAWRLVGGRGAAAKPRLRIPELVEEATSQLPAAAIPLRGGDARQEGAVLAFLGDVVLGRSMELQIDRYGPAYPWRGVGWLLEDADLAMANLECVLSTRGNSLKKPYVLRAHPGAVESLAAGGLDAAGLANNHILDFGAEGLDETLSELERAGIVAIGAGRTAEDATKAAILDVNGVRVALLAYAGAYWRGSADMPDSDLVAWSDLKAVTAHVGAARGQAEVVVVVLHAGKEYARAPSETQVAVARAAIDAGADLVVGHHPHVTQTVERYRDGLIVYSLGNAVFDIPLQSAMQGDLLRVLVSRDGLARAELWPFWIEGEIQPRLIGDGQGGPRMEVIYP